MALLSSKLLLFVVGAISLIGSLYLADLQHKKEAEMRRTDQAKQLVRSLERGEREVDKQLANQQQTLRQFHLR